LLHKAELINRDSPWRTIEQVKLATARCVDFRNTRRLHSACGDIPPLEFEAAYHQLRAAGEAA
jgi:putative transposase